MKIFNILIPIFTLSLVSICSHAQTESVQLRPVALRFGEVVRKPDGSIFKMFQSSEYMKHIGKPIPNGELGALEYCASRGMHLPSARELAELAISLGAGGFSTTSTLRYDHIETKSEDGQSNAFYFKYLGYKAPIDPAYGLNAFWSSSIYLDDSNFAYGLNGQRGRIVIGARNGRDAAVRCVSER